MNRKQPSSITIADRFSYGSFSLGELARLRTSLFRAGRLSPARLGGLRHAATVTALEATVT